MRIIPALLIYVCMSTVFAAPGGGLGGNLRQQFSYDGLTQLPDQPGKAWHRASFEVTRDEKLQHCFLKSPDIEIYHGATKALMQYACSKPGNENLYWSGTFDEINGGYSPANDAIYFAHIVQNMFRDWFHMPMLKHPGGEPMILKIYPHTGKNYPDANWDSARQVALLGDGNEWIYPLTSLGVIGHEVGHGFTQQHSDLVHNVDSGAINESFSDMTAIAVEYYSSGKTDWQIAADIMKEQRTALRYMDHPSKDCAGRKPGDACSIENVNDYKPALNEHFASGIYNRMFYLLATSSDWDVKKAYQVMVQANMNYWTRRTTFVQGACGVMRAAADLHYDAVSIARAFSGVGIDVREC